MRPSGLDGLDGLELQPATFKHSLYASRTTIDFSGVYESSVQSSGLDLSNPSNPSNPSNRLRPGSQAAARVEFHAEEDSELCFVVSGAW
jgi:hypothetical protein